MKNLLIVESPAKAKTIGKYLGKDYHVVASFGHIRDLPSKEGSVEPDKDFFMHYEVSAKSHKHVKEIVDKVNAHVFPTNTTGPRSLSKPEINIVLNSILGGL